MDCIAAAEAAETRFARAVRLWGAVEALQEAIGSPQFASTSAWVHDPYVKVARESLDPRTFEAAWAEGRAMSLQQAFQYALAETSHNHVPDAGVKRGPTE